MLDSPAMESTVKVSQVTHNYTCVFCVTAYACMCMHVCVCACACLWTLHTHIDWTCTRNSQEMASTALVCIHMCMDCVCLCNAVDTWVCGACHAQLCMHMWIPVNIIIIVYSTYTIMRKHQSVPSELQYVDWNLWRCQLLHNNYRLPLRCNILLCVGHIRIKGIFPLRTYNIRTIQTHMN